MLHGDYGSWTHFIRNIEPLAERYQLLVPDMPGYGDSGLPVLQDLVVDSAQIMADGVDALIGDDADYNIIGFSYGGIHAGHMAAIHRGRVRRVVLIGAGGMGVDAPVEYKRPMKRLSRDMDWPTRREIHRNNLAGVMFNDERVVDDLSLHLQDANTARTRIRARGSRKATFCCAHCRMRARRSLASGVWKTSIHLAMFRRARQSCAPISPISISGRSMMPVTG